MSDTPRKITVFIVVHENHPDGELMTKGVNAIELVTTDLELAKSVKAGCHDAVILEEDVTIPALHGI